MFKKLLYTLLCIIFITGHASSQCGCTNCPLFVPNNTTVNSIINISGAVNNNLGVNNSLQKVCVDFVTDAIPELSMILFAPDGSQVELFSNSGIGVGQNISFDICFIPCNQVAIPEDGFNAYFDTSDGWSQNGSYCGTYYPHSAQPGGPVGCLESFTGSVNGNWRLETTDHVGGDPATIFDWSLEFADNTGTTCIVETPCFNQSCLAYAGEITNPFIEACVGDPSLQFTITPQYNNFPQPEPTLHGYTYIIKDAVTNVILEYNPTIDLTTFASGQYEVCGLSFLLINESNIPPANGTYTTMDLEMDIVNLGICADISDACVSVDILDLPNPTLLGPDVVCAGELVSYVLDTEESGTSYVFQILSGSFTQFNPTATGIGAEVIWSSGPGIICIEATNICGTVSDCVNVTVDNNAVPITILGNSSVCPTSIETYSIIPSLNPGENYVFNVTGGVVSTSDDNSVTVVWNSVTNPAASLCVSINGGCLSPEVCLDVEILNYTPPVTLNSPNSICLNEEGLSFVIDDPTFINYNWTTTNLGILAGNGTSAVQYIALAEGIATICLEIETDCGLQPQICENITVTPLPIAIISPVDPTCDLDFVLNATTEIGANVNWVQTGGPSSAFIQNPNLSTTTVIVSVPGTYSFVLEHSLNGCIGLDQTIDVEIVFPPEAINLITDCGANQEYTVIFEIVNGEAPYLVNGIFIAGNSFVSDPFPSGSNYIFTISDINNCETIVSGTAICDCNNTPGIMSTELLESCAELGSMVSSNLLDPGILEATNDAYYILHDSPNNVLGNIIEINTTGIFSYNLNINPEQIYFISYVISNSIGGLPDLNDPCLQVSFGQPVIFHETPMDLSQDISNGEIFCEECADIVPFFTYDSILFNVQQGNGFASYVNNTISICRVDPGAFVLEYTVFLNGCSLTDVLEFEFSSEIQASIVSEECLASKTEYTLALDILGGTAPYTLSVPGSFNGSLFTSDPLKADSSYTIDIVDANGCSIVLSNAPVLCNCENDLGSFITDTIQLCENDIFDPMQISLGDYVLEAGIDTFAFLVYENESDPLDGFIGLYTDGDILFDGTFNFNTNYFIRLVIGPYAENPGIEFDFNSGCLQAGPPIAFIWQEDKSFIFDVHFTLCTTEADFTWEQPFDGPFPYNITVSDNKGTDIVFTISNNTEMLSLPIFPGLTIWEVIDYDGLCNFSYGGNFQLTGVQPIDFDLISVDSICNNAIFNSEINLDNLVNPLGTAGSWFINGNPIAGSTIDFDGYTEGSNTLSFSTAGFEDPCLGITKSFDIYVKACDCPQVFTNDISVCDSENSVNLGDFFNTNLSGTYNIINPNNLTNVPVINGSEVEFSDASEGLFVVQFELDGNWPANCVVLYEANLTIEKQGNTGTQVSIPSYCNSDYEIDLNDLLDNADAGGIWISGNDTISSIINVNNYGLGAQNFTYLIPSTGNCLEANTQVEIIIQDEAIFNINSLDFCNSESIIDLTFLISSTNDGTYTINNINNLLNPPVIINPTSLDIGNASEGTYELEFILDGNYPENCNVSETVLFTIESEQKAGVQSEFPIYCDEDSEIIQLASFMIDQDPGGVWTWNGNPITNEINTNDLTIGSNIFTYSIEATANCPAQISQLEIEIIPNPDVSILASDVLCFGDENGEIEVIIQSDDFGPYSCFLNSNSTDDKVIQNLPPGNYTLEVNNSEGCVTIIEDIVISEPEVIEVNLGDDLEANFKDLITIQALINLIESDVNTISWTDLNGLIENSSLSLTQEIIKDNSITLTITDENGCIGTDVINIRLLNVDIVLANTLVINSGFPENTRFGMPLVPSVQQVEEFRIYDRWGNQVFEVRDVAPGSDEGYWYGNYQGKDVVQGVYGYFMKFTLITGEERMLIGDVTVIR